MIVQFTAACPCKDVMSRGGKDIPPLRVKSIVVLFSGAGFCASLTDDSPAVLHLPA